VQILHSEQPSAKREEAKGNGWMDSTGGELVKHKCTSAIVERGPGRNSNT
jgi:hypothetical protein